MKTHTNEYKEKIKSLGRELDSIITYTIDGETIELGNENLNSITPHYEGSIIKSVMKQLDIDCDREIPVGTIVNYQFGIKISENEVEDYRENYEYINFGNYIVKEVEKQEDINSYKIICYDKMLYSMKKYENMNITYPIAIRDYINTICNKLGLTFKNINDTFANYNRQIQQELYLQHNVDTDEYISMGYTYRDVLDELAQVTASTICINENDDELEIRYINTTNDTINEDFLKDINVNLGEKYGPINSIVLSRSAESDNVYLQDTESIELNGLYEIKIVDNQIMNWNDRSDYLQDILEQLDGLEYYINDFSSTGITYYNLCDRYIINIGDNNYSCIMLNDEINVTQGLEENIHTEILEESKTDYTKADKTDRKINQTYLIVDKQNQTIESVVSNVGQQDEKISQITQTVDELNSKISNIMNITVSGESAYASVNLQEVNESEPILLKIRPIENNISYLHPRSNLYPSGTLYSTTRKIRFHNTTTDEIIDYELPDNLLYYNADNYDEFNLSYDSQTCTITKKCEYNTDGTIGLLATPTTITYPYPTINLTTGNYEVSILGYSSGYIYATLMASNIYTTQFATKVEMNSAINQTAEEINLEVSKKIGNNEVISKINQSAEAVTISANKIGISGVISSINNNTTTTINGDKITTGSITANQLAANSITSSKVDSSIITTNNLSAQNISANQITSGTLSANRISGGTINANNINVTNINGSNITRGSLSGIPYSYTTNTSKISITNNDDEPLMGYRGSVPRWSLAAFTTGGRFQTFDQNGNLAAYFNQTGAHTSSDIRFKDNITNINEKTSMNIINDLTPIEYTYKSCNGYHRGLSAQEVEKVLKENNIEEQIYEINKNGKYSLNYIELIPDLINCIKYLSKEIEKLKESEK